jgi:hypothetical protein
LFLGLGAALIPYFIWVQINYGFFLLTLVNALFAISDLNEPFFFYFLQFPFYYSFLVLFAVFLFLFFFIRKKEFFSSKDFFILLWLVLGFILLSFSSHKEPRYMIAVISLPIFLLASRGITLIYDSLNSIKNAKPFVLIFIFVLLLFYASPAFSRLNEPFINKEITTEEFQVSKFINELNFSEETVLYANNNWPVFAYYTGLKTVRLTPSTEDFYSVFPENMPNSGVFIAYRNRCCPEISWINERNEFEKIKEFENTVIYIYCAEEC